MCSSSLCSFPWLKSGRGGTLRLGQVEEGIFISNQRNTVALSAKTQTELSHFTQKPDSDWGWRLDHCLTMINTSRTIYKRSWLEMGRETCSAVLRGKFLQLNGCFPWLIWLQQNVPAREQGNQTHATCGVWACLAPWFFLWFAWLVGFCFVCWLVGWWFFVVFFKKRRLEMGLGAIWGAAQKAALGTHAVPMEIRGSSLRLVYSFGCRWRLPWWQSTAYLRRIPPLRILALSLIIRISEPQGRFPLNIQKDSRKPLSALSCLWKEARLQNAYNKSPRKIPQSFLDVLPRK